VPAIGKSLRTVAPHLPSVIRLAAGEGAALVPKLGSGFKTWIESKVMPSAADKAAIEQAERVEQVKLEVKTTEPMPTPKKKPQTQQLHVMA
jgi:hypothetical protein